MNQSFIFKILIAFLIIFFPLRYFFHDKQDIHVNKKDENRGVIYKELDEMNQLSFKIEVSILSDYENAVRRYYKNTSQENKILLEKTSQTLHHELSKIASRFGLETARIVKLFEAWQYDSEQGLRMKKFEGQYESNRIKFSPMCIGDFGNETRIRKIF